MESSDARDPLATVIGQDGAIQHLRNLLKRKLVPHALLFSGPDGVGKFHTARAFAAELLQSYSATGNPLSGGGEDHLRFALSGTHPDLHTLAIEEGQKDIPVDSVRELTSKLHLKSYLSSATVALINDAHRMSLAASNALLMTLEEPSANSFIILVTDASHRLPATILSRCQIINFSRLTPAYIVQIFERLLGLPIDSIPDIERLVSALDGSLEPLQMQRFLNRATGELIDRDVFKDELEKKSAEVSALRSKLRNIVAANSTPPLPLTDLISSASSFCEDKEFNPLFWRVFQLELRNAIRKAAPESVSSWSSLLTQCIFAEQSIRERNASNVLQLTSLFLKSGDIAEQALELRTN